MTGPPAETDPTLVTDEEFDALNLECDQTTADREFLATMDALTAVQDATAPKEGHANG